MDSFRFNKGILIVLFLLLPAVSHSQGFESIPEDDTLPPPPTIQGGQAWGTSVPVTQPTAEKKGKWRLLGRKKVKEDKTPPPKEEVIVNVGPREAQASGDPLVRLPLTVIGNQGKVAPGFYLAKQRILSPNSREVTLFQKNEPVFTVLLKQVAPTNTSLGPVEAAHPKKPVTPVILMNAKVAPDQRAVTLVLREGEAQYESEALPTLLDSRPTLRY